MEQFRDGQHVWLRNRVRGGYLHADDDGRGVSIRESRASRNAAWGVQRLVQNRGLMLLQGAAYGRYLAATNEAPPSGHRGRRVEQRGLHDPEHPGVKWQAVKIGLGSDVLLMHMTPVGFRYLRANGRHLRWHAGVTVDKLGKLSDMMHWTVEPIPLRATTPDIPVPPELPRFVNVLLGRQASAARRRLVRFVRAEPDGSFNDNDWTTFQFAGRYAVNLRTVLSLRLAMEEEAVLDFTMCVRNGMYARLTPLVVNLPRGSEAIDIVLLLAGTPAIDDLQYPDVDAAELEARPAAISSGAFGSPA